MIENLSEASGDVAKKYTQRLPQELPVDFTKPLHTFAACVAYVPVNPEQLEPTGCHPAPLLLPFLMAVNEPVSAYS